MSHIARVSRWMLERLGVAVTTTHEVRGVRVVVLNSRPDIETADVIARLDRCLALLEEHVPHHARRLKRDFDHLLVQRYACRGAYLPDRYACLVELTFAVNPAFSDAQVASTILHEAMHARLHRMGFPLEMKDRAREERFCRRAEVEFGLRAPGGEPVVERALGALAQTDADVAPVIDPALAERRIREADLAALRAPEWLKRAALRHDGPDR